MLFLPLSEARLYRGEFRSKLEHGEPIIYLPVVRVKEPNTTVS
jgi:hypothetical protein